jgi:hypothetical protein
VGRGGCGCGAGSGRSGLCASSIRTDARGGPVRTRVLPHGSASSSGRAASSRRAPPPQVLAAGERPSVTSALVAPEQTVRGRRLEELAQRAQRDPEGFAALPGALRSLGRFGRLSTAAPPFPDGVEGLLPGSSSPAPPPRVLRAPGRRPPPTDAEAPPWEAGDAFPAGGSGCGWELVDYVARLRDPNPVACDGTALLDDDLGFVLDTTSTTTVYRRGGIQQRMYFQNPSLGHLETVDHPADRRYPIVGTDGTPKFALADVTGSGEPILVTDDDGWWGAGDGNEAAEDRHFSGDFIAYLDAESDGTYVLWAPMLERGGGEHCWLDAALAYSGSFGRAGWNSTDIPCANVSGDVTYRDVTVLFLPTLEWWLMVAVRCDGGCEPDESGATPVTSLVCFISSDGNFRDGSTLGPFPLLPDADQPDPASEAWVGVPTAIIDPDDRHLIVLATYNLPSGSKRTLWFSPLADIEIWVMSVAIELLTSGAPFLGTPDLALGTSSPLVDAGEGAVFGRSPTSGKDPVQIDEHLAFDELGYLHLFFASRLDPTAGHLDLLARARSVAPVHPAALDWCYAVVTGTSPGTTWLVAYRLLREGFFGFEMGSCDPLCMSEVLYGSCGANSAGTDLLNDPDIYVGAAAALYAQFRSAPLGGLVFARAGEVPGFGYTCEAYCAELTSDSTSPWADALCQVSCSASLWTHGYEGL